MRPFIFRHARDPGAEGPDSYVQAPACYIMTVQLQKIILTGTPKAMAWEGKDIIEGREMIFLLKKDRFVVNERVRAKIYQQTNAKNKTLSKK